MSFRLLTSQEQITRRSSGVVRSLSLMLCSLAVVFIASCGGAGEGGGAGGGGEAQQQLPRFVSLGTSPPGGAFGPVGQALAETMNENKGEAKWEVQVKGTKGSQENIRRIEQGELQLALSNAAITYFAVNGGGTWDREYEMRTIVTIAPNVAMFITKADSGIKTIADMKGKRVVIGPAGAGFDMYVKPLLEAHGLTYDDLTVLNNDQNSTVDMLADGQADAAFLGGAVPTTSIERACSEMDMYFIPYGEEEKKELIKNYPFFEPVTIAKDRYKDLTADFEGLNVGSMHLICSANLSDEAAYELTKIIWENRADISHRAAKFIREDNAARDTGTPFHPGAIKFYKEAGIWLGDAETVEEDSTEAEGE